MKFKAKLSSMKFLTDAEEQDPSNKDLNSNNHLGRNIKIYSNSKTKTVKKLRRYKRRRRFETEDEQEEQPRQYNSRQQSYSQTPAGKVKTQRPLRRRRPRACPSRRIPAFHKLNQGYIEKMNFIDFDEEYIRQRMYRISHLLCDVFFHLHQQIINSLSQFRVYSPFYHFQKKDLTKIQIDIGLSWCSSVCNNYNNIRKYRKQMGCGAASGTKDGDPNIITPESIPRYIRKQLIGKGTYGEVYKCVDSITNSVYAMKVIKLNSKSKQQAIKQINELKSEISMLKKLNHPYIVKYQSFDVTTNQDEVEIVMELIKPGTLKQYIQKNGPLSQPVCAEVAAKILQALVYLHQQFIIHRDLKCANILITDDLIPKISDFGTAKIIYSRDVDDIAKMSASLKGTPYYMAPEVIKRSGHNQSADIWSFGCLVIQMLSGKAPWTAMNAKFSEIINYISSGVHPPFPPNISRQCNFFLESCLDAIPSKRLTAEQLLKHRFIDRNSTNATLSAKKDRNRKQSQSKPKSRTTLLNDMEIQNLEVDDRGQSGSSTVRKQINYQTPTEKRQENDPDLRKHGRRDSTSKPVKKHTQKYLNQLSRLDMLEAEMNEVEISEQQPAKDRYFIKKTLANIKSNKNSKNISKTSTTIKNTEDNLANMSSSVVDYQLRSNTQMSRQQTAINTMISRAERDQYLQQQKFLQKQRENQKKKWQQELKEGAQMLKKQLSSRYMYKV